MENNKIKFNNRQDKDFASELRTKVNAYFTENNLSIHANRPMIWKTIILFGVTFGLYFTILFAGLPPLAMLGLCMLLGASIAGIGFSVGHDALHGAYSKNKKVNKWLGYSFNIIGASDFVWKNKHNIGHHTYTNIYEHDEDVEVASFLRFSPSAPHNWFQRGQHITAFIMYGFLSLLWVAYTDFARIFKRMKVAGTVQKAKEANPEQVPTKEIFRLFGSKALYFVYMLVLPMLLLSIPWWMILIGFAAMHIVTGFCLSLVFQLAHIVESTEHPVPDTQNRMESSWMVHQLRTTANFSPRNWFLTWFVGGLNYQVEHHLFPNICSIHYPALSPIVRTVAAEYGVPYHQYRSFFSALGSHYRLLKQLGR
jgi:linoleoyl-CoA desaturase